ncbi:helix-turn-helix domain-containing protein [Paracoccus limosus]|uniref:Helix-turn-helix domain-containing protein n=1 Tax=Paracoccus limosus TaxID=913252 RepID=A0A844H421_9RHOB|nr:helix-turn-helix domain-containing protein [Paracoccus limosus]
MLDRALLTDGQGRPIRQSGPTSSRDWDEVQAFCRKVYMPYRVRPGAPRLLPAATMRMAQIGRITLTRFSYGVPIHLDRFDPEAGNILVLNTLRGALRHQQDGTRTATTRAGDSFVVDCSRTDYWLDGDRDHLQLNLTIPHDAMAEIAMRWLGFVPDDRLWTRRLAFGGNGSRWQALLAYVVHALEASGRVRGAAPMARHLEELVCMDLLQIWAEGAGICLRDGARMAAPRHVREAEEIMTSEALDPPSMAEIAARIGVSVRTLSEGFRRFRGMTPREFLRARRLDGLRAALQGAGPGDSVTSVAADWGYVNLGALAQVYRDRFGETPARTLAAGRVGR